jgi:hypothetical protein
MPDNYFEFKNRFQLIDVDGVILTSPLDAILIREPANMSEVRITLDRDEDSHGVDFEFSDKEKPFSFTRVKVAGEVMDGYALLKQLFDTVGVDAKCVFQMLTAEPNTAVFTVQYEADLDFEEYEEIDKHVKLKARRINFNDLFRTRIDVPISLEATESLDGDAITGITAVDMFMHSKVIKYNVEGDLKDAGQVIQDITFDAVSYKPAYTLIPFNEVVLSGMPTYREYGTKIVSNLPTDVSLTILGGDEFEGGQYAFDISFVFSVTWTNGLGFTNNNFYIDVYFKIIDEDENVIQTTTIFTATAFAASGTTRTLSANTLANWLNDVIIDKSWKVYLYATITNDVGTTTVTNVTFNSSHIEIEALTSRENSLAKTYKCFDVFNQILAATTGIESIIESDLLETTLVEIYNTNGYLIRGFDEAVHPPQINFKEHFFKWLQPTFGAGFAFVDDAGTKKLKIDRYSDFYTENEIVIFDTIVDGTFNITVDTDLIANEISIGYKTFPKSTDENTNQNLDEFNTVHSLLTPIQKVKKKATYISNVIASGFKIENQRAEQFKTVPKDTVSDDEKIFAIVSTFDSLYNMIANTDGFSDMIFTIADGEIQLYGDFLDIRVGETINLQRVIGSSANDGDYVIIAVDNSGTHTSLRTSTVIPLNEFFTGDWTLTFTAPKLRAARDEEFDVLTGVISPETVYNVGLNPKYMLMNQSLILNSGFNKKAPTAVIKTQEAKLNDLMECQFAAGEGRYVLDPDNFLITMSDDLALSDLNAFSKLFTGRTIKFKVKLPYSTILAIKASHNDLADGDFYGYIKVLSPFEGYLEGFLMSMVYNPMSEMVDFVLREKAPFVAPVIEVPVLSAVGGTSKVDLSWTEVFGAIYDIYRAPTSGGTFALVIANEAGLSASNVGLTGGTTYYYKMKAKIGIYESLFSNEASATAL